ncbi:MAG: hypothetical protein ABL966_05575, partial [Acidimicrobiales bacterium]
LQLVTGPHELIDLHPHITVVAGLDDAGRARLIDAVRGLSTGRARDAQGLLEAHGVLFDLSPEALALLDVTAADLQPVVTQDDLPTAHRSPRARERSVAQRTLDEITDRWTNASEEHARAEAALVAAPEVEERARRALDDVDADTAGQIEIVDRLTAQLDQAVEQRRRLTDDQASLAPQVAQAEARRAEVAAATESVRSARQVAAERCAVLAAQLDEARIGRDPSSADAVEAAVAAVARAEEEVEAEREAERVALAEAAARAGDEPPTARLARVQDEIDAAERRLAGLVAVATEPVAEALDRVRSLDRSVMVPMPEAVALIEELSLLEVELVSTEALGGTPGGGLAEGRVRLDDAHQALLEAEQAVRNPELDRDLVDRLEHTHADLLDATEKAGGRFGGGRAQRRVESLRAAEQTVLDEMGFTSYSDYMMGNSLLHVDPAKEATLDAARAELADAEDAWRTLQAATDAELERAERMERRRGLLDDARALLGRPISSGSVIEALGELQVEAEAPGDATAELREALDHAGVALGDEALDRDDLVLIAEAWLVETKGAAAREQALRDDLERLAFERIEAVGAVEAEQERSRPHDGPTPEERRQARLDAAHADQRAAEARLRAHQAIEARSAALAEELATAAEAARIASEEAAEADAAYDAAVEEEADLRASLERITAELAAAMETEATTNDELREHTDQPADTPDALAAAHAQAAAARAAAEARVAKRAGERAAIEAQRRQATADLGALDDGEDVEEEASLAEAVEWYLLARLAAQRSVSLAGSVPLLLDDALVGLDEDELEHVLGRLERMAEAVQVIVVSDDDKAANWARLAGGERAAVVRAQPSSTR